MNNKTSLAAFEYAQPRARRHRSTCRVGKFLRCTSDLFRFAEYR